MEAAFVSPGLLLLQLEGWVLPRGRVDARAMKLLLAGDFSLAWMQRPLAAPHDTRWCYLIG